MSLIQQLKELREESWQEVIKDDTEYITIIPIRVVDQIIAQLEAGERLAQDIKTMRFDTCPVCSDKHGSCDCESSEKYDTALDNAIAQYEQSTKP